MKQNQDGYGEEAKKEDSTVGRTNQVDLRYILKVEMMKL